MRLGQIPNNRPDTAGRRSPVAGRYSTVARLIAGHDTTTMQRLFLIVVLLVGLDLLHALLGRENGRSCRTDSIRPVPAPPRPSSRYLSTCRHESTLRPRSGQGARPKPLITPDAALQRVLGRSHHGSPNAHCASRCATGGIGPEYRTHFPPDQGRQTRQGPGFRIACECPTERTGAACPPRRSTALWPRTSQLQSAAPWATCPDPAVTTRTDG